MNLKKMAGWAAIHDLLRERATKGKRLAVNRE